eukprot:366097-Chlamydomonas_euryale.AAC.38
MLAALRQSAAVYSLFSSGLALLHAAMVCHPQRSVLQTASALLQGHADTKVRLSLASPNAEAGWVAAQPVARVPHNAWSLRGDAFEYRRRSLATLATQSVDGDTVSLQPADFC